MAETSEADIHTDNKSMYDQFMDKRANWLRWMWDDPHHAIWKQIYSMLLADLSYRTIAFTADADSESALHCEILARGLIMGYAPSQALYIRRLVDTTKKTISLYRLVDDIKKNRTILTRENYFYAEKDKDTVQAQYTFDHLSGSSENARQGSDQIRKQIFTTLKNWLGSDEIKQICNWSNEFIAHAADPKAQYSGNFNGLAPTMSVIENAQRHIVRVAEVLSVYILRKPIHLSIVPVLQYSQFQHFQMLVSDPEMVKKAQAKWGELAEIRDSWTEGVFDELLST